MYDPNQPRIPEGHQGGGRWTRGGYGPLNDLGAPRLPEDDADDAPQTRDGYRLLSDLGEPRLPEDPAAAPQMRNGYPQYALLPAGYAAGQLAFQGGRFVVQKGIEAALALFAGLSARNSQKRQAVIEFRAREFVENDDDRGLIIVEQVRELDRETVATKVCTRLNDVEKLVDDAFDATPRERGQGKAAYASAVHKTLARKIDKLELDPKKIPLEAEVSFVDGEHHAPYGKEGSIRVDVLEYIGNGTVCIYDLKTGNAVLDPVRMFKIARKVFAGYGGSGIKVERIIVTQVRQKEDRATESAR